LLRAIAHLLLDQVCSEGVPEAVQALVELRDVYELAARPRLLPAPSRRDVAVGSIERRTAPPLDIELE